MAMAGAREFGRSRERTGSLSQGIWRLADPKISLASLSSVYLGACVSAGSLDYSWLALTVLGVLFIEVAKNASGEFFDFASEVRDGDGSPFPGGKRVLAGRVLTPKQTGTIAGVALLGAILAGLWIAIARDPGILVLGAIGAACVYFYRGAPFQLSFHGLGETSVAFCYGPLLFAATLMAQRQALSLSLLAMSLPLGLLIAAFLWIHEYPDVSPDRSDRRRTLVVRLGRDRADRIFAGLIAVAAALVLALPWMGAPREAWWGLVFLAPASAAATLAGHRPETSTRVIAARALSLVSVLAYSAGAGIGLRHFS
jgi:1,4-dihydroxy-2-naphthoate octaprenyltransferase